MFVWGKQSYYSLSVSSDCQLLHGLLNEHISGFSLLSQESLLEINGLELEAATSCFSQRYTLGCTALVTDN